MRHVVYVSSASSLMSEGELMSLLEVSRARNAADGLTGMLLYKGGNFMQLLEGEDQPLENTCARIRRDPRHQGLIFLLDEEIAERSFVDWAMGFRSVVPEDLERVPGFARLGDQTFTSPAFVSRPDRAVRLLKTFYNLMR
jgi:hypothetical protein